jgi:hypothetical protein
MSAQPRNVVHPDIKPDNPPERASRYIDVPNMPWESRCPLGDAAGGADTANGHVPAWYLHSTIPQCHQRRVIFGAFLPLILIGVAGFIALGERRAK